MDIADVRQLFPITRNYNFQNTAAVGPISTRVVDAMNRYLQRDAEHGYLGSGFYKHADQVRIAAAKLIHADPDEVTFIKSTSEGLSFVANGLSWSTGDNVVTAGVEFPSNVYPWLALQSRGVKIKTVIEEDGRIPMERLAAAIDGRTRLVTISAVQYASGFRTDLAALGEICKERGVFLCVDAIQALGVSPIDVHTMQIDFLSADGHKWLCGPEGAGIFFVRRELIGHLRPSTVGWNSMKQAWNFDDILFEFRDDAKRFDAGAYNLAGIFGLGAAIDLILEVGVDQISAYVQGLTNRLVEGLRAKGYRVTSPRLPGEASSIVAFISDSHDLAGIQAHLQTEYRIVTALRKGRLRSSPHFFNTPEEIDQLVAALPGH